MDIDEFILKNADSIWLLQNKMWEYIGHQQCQSEEHKARKIIENDGDPFSKVTKLNFKI